MPSPRKRGVRNRHPTSNDNSNSPENRPRRKGVHYNRAVAESTREEGKTTAVRKTQKKKRQQKEGAKKAVEEELT
eukprot:15338592-Ditylum_brightwellii.AAC.1